MGAPTVRGWKWWEHAAPDVFALQFDTKMDAAKQLWLVWLRSGSVRESEDPKTVLKAAHSANPWGPLWKQDGPSEWSARPVTNRIWKIEQERGGYRLIELWRGAMTGEWKEVYAKAFRTPAEVKAHFPVRLREAEDPKSVLRAAADPNAPQKRYLFNGTKKVGIVGRRWFDRRYGNTYFTAQIYVNDELVHTLPMQYGYGGHFYDVAMDWLEQQGYLPPRGDHPRWWYRDELGIQIESSAEDVRRKRDLFV